MVTFDELLGALWLIRCAADPNDSPESQGERLAEIYDIAAGMTAKSGWQPRACVPGAMARQEMGDHGERS